MRNVTQNFLYKTTHIHSPQRHKREIFSCTQMCQVPFTLCMTHLVCTPHTATTLSQRNQMKPASLQIKNCVCKRTLPIKISWRGKWLLFLLHRHIGTGGSRNRFWHKVELKKKSMWFERTPAIIKKIQMPVREHNVCKTEWTWLSQSIFGELPKETNPPAYLKRKFGFTSSEHLPINTQNSEDTLRPNSENISTQCKMAPHNL